MDPSTATEVKGERIPWVPLLIILIVFSFIAPTVTAMLPPVGAMWYNWGVVACFLWLPVAPAIFCLLASLVRRLPTLGHKIGANSFTFLYSIGMVASLSIGALGGYPLGFYIMPFFIDRFINTVKAEQLVPWFLAPPKDIAQQILTGGMPISWGAWIPTILFWGAWWAFFSLFYLAVTAILRRLWIDIEVVPFPHTMVVHEAIQRSLGTGEKSSRLPFIIGVLLGLIWQAPLFMTVMFPWFPDIYGWRTNTCRTGGEYVIGGTPLAQIVGIATFNKDPVVGAIFYMAPLSVLQSATLSFLMFLIFNQAAYVMGYFTGITDVSGCGRTWCGSVAVTLNLPFKWNAVTNCGMAAGIVIFYLAINRRYLAETFRAAFGRLPPERVADMEKKEPVSYRFAYMLLAISTVLLIALFMGMGLRIQTAVAMLIAGFIYPFAMIRVYSLIGWMGPATEVASPVYYKLLAYPQMPTEQTSEWVVNGIFSSQIANGPFYGAGAGLLSGLSSFRMAHLLGTDNKSVFKVLLVACLVAPIVSLCGYLWSLYTFGLQNLPYGSTFNYGAIDSSWASITRIADWPAKEPWLPYYVVGILIAGAISFLHARFLWFPLEPVGFIVATELSAWLEGVWTMFVATWVLKMLTLRVGGSKLYQNRGAPLAGGFVVGFVIVSFVGSLALIARFFVPF